MDWKYKSALRKRASVTILCVNEDDPENVVERTFTYTYPMYDGQSKVKFCAAVKGEVKAHLDHLNLPAETEDVTTEFQP